MRRDFYVDDLLTSANAVHEAIELQKQLSSLLAEGGFELRKWFSNSQEVLQQIPESFKEIRLPISMDFDENMQ